VKGVDAEAYRRLRPYVCALPTSQLSPLNVNTLTPEQAPLITMLTGGVVGPERARAVIARRPRDGWASSEAFWSQSELQGYSPDDETRAQATVLTRFFRLRVDVDYAGVRAVRTALLEARPDGAVRTVIQRWTPEE
jgi:general secretion pathway protein K